ncbi:MULTISPECIES: hypothetical protein [unclassified Pedobacter]|nr:MULTISPECIES: hypothetical protein [unclassified Pedobacter]
MQRSYKLTYNLESNYSGASVKAVLPFAFSPDEKSGAIAAVRFR